MENLFDKISYIAKGIKTTQVISRCSSNFSIENDNVIQFNNNIFGSSKGMYSRFIVILEKKTVF